MRPRLSGWPLMDYGFASPGASAATRDFDHRRIGDLDSRTEPIIEDAARPDRLPDQRADRPSFSRQSCLQLARDHDRRTIAGDKLKINARAREANPSHHAFNHHKSAVPAAQLRGIRRLYHGKRGITPYSYFPLAGLLFDCKSLGGAAAGLELRPDAGIARRQQRRRGRAGGPVSGIRRRDRRPSCPSDRFRRQTG